jgi:pimeloyl-ACP methyl ester carboxylesterase
LFFSTGAIAQSENFQVTRFSGPDASHHSYFINGLASAIPEVGYGLRNLSRNLRGQHYSYITPVESTGPIQILVISDIRKRLKIDPAAKINLIGISYGGNIATLIAQQLNLYKIPVNYLAVLDAPAPVPITRNVHRVDNFYCRRIGCIGQRIQMAWGNKDTIKEEFRVKSGHIQLSATQLVETRITGQLSEVAMNLLPAVE